ncbi:MAG: DNA-directed RNA polymerase subunit omega [Candidatus Omnitrophica bacterium]|nr:DNA-directed RNA polymerase subunit omega [Candidatus Omnitrophota bacterium]
MPDVPIEDLLKQVSSRYKLVNLASRRAVELNHGSQMLVELGPKVKLSTVALEEIKQGKINYEVTESKD